jgi:acetyl esterase/lipase
MLKRAGLLALGLVLVLGFAPVRAADDGEVVRQQDVIYGRKWGLAMTMDVFTPKTPNGAAVVAVMSGGWFSAKEMIRPDGFNEYTKRGYTVFAVMHGSQPKFTIPEAVEDMNRAVKFIRAHAKEYKIDPDRIGITGGSAGGHLSLMIACAPDKGDSTSKDPVEAASAKVQAAAVFFPPTDFENWGKADTVLSIETIRDPFKPAFDFRETDKATGRFLPVTDEKKVRAILHQISPINHVSSENPPVLIIHGDKDDLVPIQQAEIMMDRLKDAKVPARLVVKEGAKHGWQDMGKDRVTMADWFDQYLLRGGKEK